jgi:hypothetical protein
MKFYTPLRVSEHVPEFVKEEVFKKNEFLQYERSIKDINGKLLMLVEGRVIISK